MTSATQTPLAFQPLKLGRTTLSHRIAMAPLTRFRASKTHAPLIPMVPTYYGQRASAPGTLLVTEATFISPRASGYNNVPGIWTDEQVAAWRKVTDTVHSKGSTIFLQLWALGRTAVPDVLAAETQEALGEALPVQGASAIPYGDGTPVPEPLTVDAIRTYVSEYANAARRAIEAGFDGVEIHGANGYLLDQFIQDVSNQRTDAYGGSIEKRVRFPVEVATAIVDAIGADRTAIRLSPWGKFQGMKMEDPVPTFSYLIEKLKELRLAYIHLVEPRVEGNVDRVPPAHESNKFALDIWGKTSPVLLAGGFQGPEAVGTVEQHKDVADVVVVYGRYFIANPDLVFKVKHGLSLDKMNRDTVYIPMSEEGYTDYPFSNEFLQEQSKEQSVSASL